MAFSFNSRAKYPTGATEVLSATQAAITSDALIKLQIQVRSSDGFQTQYPDVFGKYRPPNVNLDKIVQAWKSTPMQFWAKPGQLCHLVRHRGLRRFSARSPVRTRQINSVPIPFPHVLPNKEDFGRDTSSTAPGSSLGCL